MDEGPKPGLSVLVSNEQDDQVIDADRWRRLAEQVLDAEGIRATEVSVTFSDEAHIAELKRLHLDGDGSPTDVLAFPIDGVDGDSWSIEPHVLGDVVICPAVAARQAPDHAGSFDDEVALLLVHGLLHLLGMDHAERDDQREMQARERALLDRLHGELARDPWDGSGNGGSA